ncbi:hypothetical protein R5H30_00710 [Sulfitobacter sp. D35]|uniref:hypothetical protein n=1 Tax=Sulfitobacter sp. D35 TaxID=3083252 RepID=UPI00296E37F7|nr:hypothetical protein [Sulfitobacter sp. D35]MDW4496485.1 hypothetical protein [Sulfitobacter sp. D35]
MDSVAGQARLATVLSRVSRHLDGMAGQIFSLEEAVSRGMPGRAADHAAIRELQTLDFLRQSLEDLALLAHQLHLHADTSNVEDLPVLKIARALKLDSTRTLLDCAAGLPVVDDRATVGDLDLF